MSFRMVCAFWAVLVVAPMFGAHAVAAEQERPNIVVIMSDDMGFSDIGCYGGEIRTPNLDRLAANGLRFTQFYNTGRCCPTRASLLTGLYPHQAGIGWMMSDRGYDGYRGDLNRHCMTFGEVMHLAGYATYAVGKWHVTKYTDPDGPKDNWPLQRGFDRFYGTITGAGSYYDPGTLTRDNTMISPFADPEYKPKKFYYTDAIGDHAVRFIRENPEGKPFFMYVAFTAAHWPMHALEEDIAKYHGMYDEGYEPIRLARFERLKKMGLISPDWDLSPQHGDWDKVTHKEWEARCMEVYAAMIDRLDQNIGKIVAALQEKGVAENTLVFFLQDNGGCQEGVGRSGNWKRPVEPTLPPIPADAIRTDVIPKQNRAGVPTLTGPNIMPGPEDTYIAYGIDWANVSNTPFREYKHYVHEGGISTPLIAYWPKGIPRKGELETQPGHLIDIMATCVDLAGVEYPEEYRGEEIYPLEGVSLRPVFTGGKLNRSNPLFWEHEGNRAVRDGKWKLVAKENQPWELYDMEADRTEMHDLSAEHPEIVARLEAAWNAWAERAHVLPLGAWRGQPKPEKLSTKKRFELEPGADLKRDRAPMIAEKPFRITVDVAEAGTRGVLVAQGGSSQGYALYVDEQGALRFALRRDGKLDELVSAVSLKPGTKARVVVELDAHGILSLKVDGKPAGRAETGLMPKMPADGLQVGQDAIGAVGPYAPPFAYDGRIERVLVEILQ
ncbi:hypothetical protein JCM19992_08370 [Thermostilla marina]